MTPGAPITTSAKTVSEAAGLQHYNNAWTMCAGSAATVHPVRTLHRHLHRTGVRGGITIIKRLVLGFLFCACASNVYGQSNSIDREIRATPERDVRVGIYTSMRSDCTAGPLPAIRLSVAPEHGSVTVRRATLKATNVKQCLAAELPAFVAFYRPKADSATDDRFELEVSSAAGRKQIQRFHITISPGANGGQRI
jgi:hypothetical protein